MSFNIGYNTNYNNNNTIANVETKQPQTTSIPEANPTIEKTQTISSEIINKSEVISETAENKLSLTYASEALKNDKNVVLAAVSLPFHYSDYDADESTISARRVYENRNH